MNTGLIVKVTEKYAVVINSSHDYVKLNAKDGLLIGKQIYYTPEDIYQKGPARRVLSFRYATVFAMLLLVILAWQLLNQQSFVTDTEVYAVVTMDINPSLEIHLDKQGLVEEVLALNSDGERLVNFDYKHQSFESVMIILLNKAASMGYLQAEGTVLLATSPVEQMTNPTLDIDGKLELFLTDQTSDYTFIYCKGDEEDLRMARNASISLGRLKIIQLIDDTIIDDVSLLEMTISDFAKNGSLQPALSKASQSGDLRMFKAGELTSGDSQVESLPQTSVTEPQTTVSVEPETLVIEEGDNKELNQENQDLVPPESTTQKQNEGTNGKGKKGGNGSGSNSGQGDGQGK